MSESTTLPAPDIGAAAPLSKWEREHRAFQRLLPQLIATHRGQYVAVHNEQVVESGDEKLPLALRVLAKIGNVPIHVGLVTEAAPPTYRSGVRRVVQPEGGAG